MTEALDNDCAGEGEQGARRYYGKYAGIVVDNAAAEGSDHRGQLVVSVPGILEETADGSDSQPIAVTAAPCFLPGFFFIPEIDAQVWVEFVAGDINHPIWTGVWYPVGAVPVTSNGGAPTDRQKVIRTASGQVIQLDDTDGAEKLVVKDEANANTITLDKNGMKIECAQQAGTSTITLDASGVTITFGQSTLSIKQNSIEINEGATVAAKLEAAGVSITSAAGAAQAVVLAPLLDWLLSHQHVGNMGAPTPLFPADIATLQAQKPLMTSKV